MAEPGDTTLGRADLCCRGHTPPLALACRENPRTGPGPTSYHTGCELQLRLWRTPALQPLRVAMSRALSPEERLGVHLNALPAGARRQQAGPGEERSAERARVPCFVIPQARRRRRSASGGSRPRKRWGGTRTPGTRREHHPPARRVPGARRPRAAASSHLTSQEASAHRRGEAGLGVPSAGCRGNCSGATGGRRRRRKGKEGEGRTGAARLGRKGGGGAGRRREDYREEMRVLRRVGMRSVAEHRMQKRTREEGIT